MLKLLTLAATVSAASAANEYVVLHNTVPNGTEFRMPAIGLGTGGYGATHNNYGAYPECERPPW
jgi:hypothetical protein